MESLWMMYSSSHTEVSGKFVGGIWKSETKRKTKTKPCDWWAHQSQGFVFVFLFERMSLKWTHPTKTQTKKTMDSTRQRKDKEITKKRHATRGCLWQAKHTFCWSESVKTKHTFWSSESVKPWHLLQVRPTNWGHPSCAPYDDLHLLQHEKSTQSFQLFLTRCEELILFLIWTHMKHIKIWYINIWTRIEILHVFQACTPMSENTTTGSKRPWEESSQWAIWERTLES